MLDGHQMITTEELGGLVKDIVNAFSQYRSAATAINQETKDTLNFIVKQVNAEHERILADVANTSTKSKSDVTEALKAAIKECRAMYEEIMTMKPQDGAPGLDADEDAVVEKVLEKLPKVKELIPDTPEEVVTKINKSKNKIKGSQIEGLAESFNNLSKSVTMGGVQAPILDVYNAGSLVKTRVTKINFSSGATVSGDTVNVTTGGAGSGITVGSTTITSGTTTRVLYDNAGVVGEYAISGTGNVAMTNTPTLTTPIIGSIKDTNSNTILSLNPITSAVNYVQIENDVAGSAPHIRPAGSDTNINLHLEPKGTGVVAISGNGADATTRFRFLTTGASTGTGLTLASVITANRTITFPDATGTASLQTGLVANQIAYASDSNTISSLTTATYPSLTELSYVKGVTSSIQTQLNAKGAGTVTSVSFTGGLISVATATTTPAFTVAGTSGGVPYFSSASTWATSAALAANAIVIGGGAGAAPATTTTGTGVLTALGINVGTAGAFVVNGGALGTPSSGTVTNLTGTASININGTVGATTPTTGSFTTVTASTSTTSPIIIGGTGTTSTLTLQPTSGVGTTGADIIFKVGNNGATEAMRVASSGNIGIGTANPSFALDISVAAPRIRQTATTGTNSSLIQLANTGGTAYIGLDNASAGISAAYALALYHSGAYPITFSTSGTEAMRLDANRNLLVGTTSQVYSEKLAVQNDQNASTYQLIRNNNSGASAASALALNAFGNSWGIEIGSTAKNSNALTFNVDYLGTPVERMRLTTDGNLGLGITPNAWHSNFRVLQTGLGYASFVGDISNGYAELVNNCYASAASTYNYVASLAATRYSQQLGVHRWYVAGAGTSGAAITFINAMTLSNNGTLLVGTTSASGLWSGSERLIALKSTSSDAAGVQVSSSNAQNTTIELFSSYSSSVVGLIAKGDSAHQSMIFSSYNGASYAERARIDTSGNFLVEGASGDTVSTSTYGLQFTNVNQLAYSQINTVLEGSGGINGYGGVLRFYTKGDNSSSLTERMRIDYSGNATITTSLNVPQVFNAMATATVTANAATITRANRNNKFVNSSAAAMTITLSTASAAAGDMLLVQIYDFSAATQPITWVNTENSTVTVPATSNGSTTLPLTAGFMWNASTSKWRIMFYS